MTIATMGVISLRQFSWVIIVVSVLFRCTVVLLTNLLKVQSNLYIKVTFGIEKKIALYEVTLNPRFKVLKYLSILNLK